MIRHKMTSSKGGAMDSRVLTTGEIAQYCHVTQRTVVQWINEGKLKANQTPGKHNRVNSQEFLAFLDKFKMTIPEDFKERNQNRKKKILIVDDEKEIVQAIKRVLLRVDQFELEEAFDGFEAGEKFSEMKPDLVILDIKMPGIDGYELCQRIRQKGENQQTKILVISGVIDEKIARKIMNCGADDYLEKPFDNNELKDRIRQLFGWTRRMSDAADKVLGE